MRERKEVLDYGLTLPDTYIDTPFHDDNCGTGKIRGHLPGPMSVTVRFG